MSVGRQNGTYLGQISKGCFEFIGVIRVDSVGEYSTANKSGQSIEKFVYRHVAGEL
jgi:hypothetical protein